MRVVRCGESTQKCKSIIIKVRLRCGENGQKCKSIIIKVVLRLVHG